MHFEMHVSDKRQTPSIEVYCSGRRRRWQKSNDLRLQVMRGVAEADWLGLALRALRETVGKYLAFSSVWEQSALAIFLATLA